MTIDFHAHPVPDAFRKWLPLLDVDVIADDGFPLPQWSKEAHLQFMENAGIDYMVLSLPTPKKTARMSGRERTGYRGSDEAFSDDSI